MAEALEWYYRRGDERGGPVVHDVMCRMVAERTMPLDTKVWREGFVRFMPASTLPGFVDAESGQARAKPPPAEGAPLTAIMTDPWSPSEQALAEAEAEAAAAATSAEPIATFRPGFAGGQLVRERGAGDPPADVSQRRPWVRFWARGVDGILNAAIVVTATQMIGMPLPRTYVEFLLYIAFFLLLEPVMLAMFGTTPGKWLLRVRVLGLDGEKPGVAEAVFRRLAVWVKGEALNIPIFYVLFLPLAYLRLVNRGSTSWDENGGFIVRHDRVGPARALLAAGVIIGGGLLLAGPAQQVRAELQRNIGQLTGRTEPGRPAAGNGSASVTSKGARGPAPSRPAPARKAPPKKIVM